MIMRNLKICHINARSVYASRCHDKLDELTVVASVHDFDIDILRYLITYVSWRCGQICVLLLILQKTKFSPLQIIHLFILHYDSATKH